MEQGGWWLGENLLSFSTYEEKEEEGVDMNKKIGTTAISAKENLTNEKTGKRSRIFLPFKNPLRWRQNMGFSSYSR